MTEETNTGRPSGTGEDHPPALAPSEEILVNEEAVRTAVEGILMSIPSLRTLIEQHREPSAVGRVAAAGVAAATSTNPVVTTTSTVAGSIAEGLGTGPTSISTPLGIMPSVTALAGLPLIGGPTITGATALPTKSTSASALTTNLLPYANTSLKLPSTGAYVGEGIPPVPPKLVEKINRREFVEMGELLPEFWAAQKGEEKESRGRRSRKVTDIFTWLQCYGSYVAVLIKQHPHLISEMMAYMNTIIRVSQDYAGLAWVRYDAAFCRQAALMGNDRWSAINTTLYTMCFTGMASATRRCELCFATTHTERECAQRGDPDMADRLKNLEAAVLAISKPHRAQSSPSAPARASGEPCRKWNGGNCSYPNCRHSHICSGCKGNHPVVRCPARQGQQGEAAKQAQQRRPY